MEQSDSHTIALLVRGEQPDGMDVPAYLDNLCQEYPYSQVLQMLRAKAYQDAGKDTEKIYFQKAYAYAPDKQRYMQFIQAGQQDPAEEADTQKSVSRQVKQQAIVDRFLEANPRITPRREEIPEPEIVSKSLSDDSFLVSETLAEVLLKQGKTGKALDIYEKLCLKYPEKSSYFAKKIRDINSAAD